MDRLHGYDLQFLELAHPNNTGPKLAVTPYHHRLPQWPSYHKMPSWTKWDSRCWYNQSLQLYRDDTGATIS